MSGFEQIVLLLVAAAGWLFVDGFREGDRQDQPESPDEYRP